MTVDSLLCDNSSLPVPAGTAIEDTFTPEEIAIPVKCKLHPWMKSHLAVFKHPLFAITGKDGGVELNDLPPGHIHAEALA